MPGDLHWDHHREPVGAPVSQHPVREHGDPPGGPVHIHPRLVPFFGGGCGAAAPGQGAPVTVISLARAQVRPGHHPRDGDIHENPLKVILTQQPVPHQAAHDRTEVTFPLRD